MLPEAAGGKRVSPITQRFRRAGGALLGIVAIVFVAEMAVMGVLVLVGLAAWNPLVAVLDGLLLAVLVAAPVYGLLLLPVHREQAKRRAAERRARQLDRLAMSDPLTGVLNRRGILARLLEAMAHAERYERHLSVAMLDLDRFKRVNDRHGHACGDGVLRQAADRFSSVLRASDLIGRLGGDEFLVVLPETGLELAAGWAERVRRLMDGAGPAVGGVPVDLAVSIGVCELVAHEGLSDLLRRVDHALYRAKELGRREGRGAVCAVPLPPASPAAGAAGAVRQVPAGGEVVEGGRH